MHCLFVRTDEEVKKALSVVQPWNRIGVPADIGRAVAFLARKENDFITGTDLGVDGGVRLKFTQPEETA